MKRLKKIGSGGIEVARSTVHFEETRNAFLPRRASVPMRQHSGTASRCLVRPGDFVREGMIIGRADERGALNVHSPIPGVVTDVRRAACADGSSIETVVIALQGSFEILGKRREVFPWKTLTRHEILHIVHDKGVADSDARAMSLYERLVEYGQDKKDGYLVVSAVECDGLSRTESTLLRERAAALLEGIEMLKKVTMLQKARVLVSDAEAFASAERLAALAQAGAEPCSAAAKPKAGKGTPSGAGLEIAMASALYPQDHVKKLEEVLVANYGGSPLVLSASSLLAVYEAVALNKPMIERYVTVAGGAVPRPAVLRARIGTSIGDLFEECGGFASAPEFIAMDSPFSGTSVFDLDTPIEKTTRSVFALLPDEVRRSKTVPCIRCGRCADACPEGIEPFLLYKYIDRGRACEYAELERYGIGSCIECGACAHVCPSRIPLVHAISTARKTMQTKAEHR